MITAPELDPPEYLEQRIGYDSKSGCYLTTGRQLFLIKRGKVIRRKSHSLIQFDLVHQYLLSNIHSVTTFHGPA
jgi:hypothetical protein